MPPQELACPGKEQTKIFIGKFNMPGPQETEKYNQSNPDDVEAGARDADF
jgi:hypothetical protein